MPEVGPFLQDSVEGFLHVPAVATGSGLVLTHGAGADCRTVLLVLVAEAFTQAGFHVLRCNLPFRQQRRSGPPHPAQAAADQAGLRKAVGALRSIITGGPIVLGGHSYGGRQATMLAASDPSVANGLLLLSYPLHPPHAPDKPRTAHFPQLRNRCLFVHGSKDPFGTVPEMASAIHLIPAGSELSIIEKAGHELARGRFDIGKLIVDRAVCMLQDAE